MRIGTKAAAAIAALTLAGAANIASAQEYVFKFHHLLSAKSPAHTQMIEPWARAVEENSGGKVKIEIFPSMTLGGRPPELVEQVRDGVVDLVWTVNGYTPGLFPRSEVAELPFVMPMSPRAVNLALHDIFEDELKSEYAGLEVMFLHVHAGQALHMTEKAVRSPADAADLRLRIPSRTGAWIIEALGATPIGMPVPDLPQSLQKGVVDGALIPFEIIPPLKLQEQTKYQIEGADGARFGNIVFQVSMNKDRWDSLPPEVQKAFRDASGRDWWGEVGDIWAQADVAGIEVATKAGNEHIVLSADETAAFQKALAPLILRWSEELSGAGVDAQKLLRSFREALGKTTTE